MDDEVRVEYRRLSDLARWPRNPKQHDLPQLKASIRRFGFVLPLVEDASTGQLVAGHGRLEALLQMQRDGEPAPARVKVGDDGGWSAPVVAGVGFSSEAEAEAYVIADNRLVEVGGWDAEALQEMLRGLEDVSGTGYTQHDLDFALKLDALPEPPPEFREYDESVAAEPEKKAPRGKQVQCPECGHGFTVG